MININNNLSIYQINYMCIKTIIFQINMYMINIF